MVKNKKEPPPTEEKTTRKDVKQCKDENENTEFTCIKMRMNSLVENISIMGFSICFLSYQFLNYHFTREKAKYYQKKYTVSDYEKYQKEKIDTTDELYMSFSQWSC